MNPHVLIVDTLALIVAVAGFLVAFRQSWVRRQLRHLSGRDPDRPARETAQGEDPVHYAMIISGVMLMAFGIIMFAFTTSYALLTG